MVLHKYVCLVILTTRLVWPIDIRSQFEGEAYRSIGLTEAHISTEVQISPYTDNEPTERGDVQKAPASSVILPNSHIPRERKKRSVGAILTGIRAIRRLLFETRYKKEESTKAISVFEKSGNYAKAILDFFSVGPINVKKSYSSSGTLIRTGNVGDRTLILRAGKETPYPTLKIFHKPKGGDVHIDTIKYIKD